MTQSEIIFILSMLFMLCFAGGIYFVYYKDIKQRRSKR